jgi:hypothetical protein
MFIFVPAFNDQPKKPLLEISSFYSCLAPLQSIWSAHTATAAQQ